MSSIWRPVRERNPARSLMVVVAHPGDEAFGFGGAIAHAASFLTDEPPPLEASGVRAPIALEIEV